MRIAMLAPLAESVPPKQYGGTERVVYVLTEELVARGHDVTLFASGNSTTSANLVSVYPTALREAKLADVYGHNIWSALNIGNAYALQHEFDVIHDHTGYLGLPTANLAETPVVSTYHGPITPDVRSIYRKLNKPHLVTISHSQRAAAPELNHIATVYNGLPLSTFPFSETHDGYLLFVGRISPEKGVHHAIEVAHRMRLPLIMAAKLDATDHAYFKEQIEPHLSDQIRWIGEVDEATRNRLYSRALAFLHPVTWPEPFGLTLIEAMSTGCPVIAFSQGSIPEVVRDGTAGFVVGDVEGMIDAVKRVGSLDRKACRDYAVHHFNESVMTDRYEQVYRCAIERSFHLRRSAILAMQKATYFD